MVIGGTRQKLIECILQIFQDTRSCRNAVPINVSTDAARSPLSGLPRNSQFFLPMATRRICCPISLLSIGMRPSVIKLRVTGPAFMHLATRVVRATGPVNLLKTATVICRQEPAKLGQ